MRLTSDNRIRKEIAHKAAKLVAIDGLEDFLQAKRKAAQQLGINNKRLLPNNKEIEAALIEYQSLFHDDKQTQDLLELRQIAYKTMLLLEEYNPRLVGSLLTGTANQHSEIMIHVFSGTSEEISLFLENKSIPVSICERRLQIEKNSHVYFTALKFIAGNVKIVLLVLPTNNLKITPIDPVTEGPMKRANLNDVKKLIDSQ
jgi:predicted nucleotidyltransferase